MEQKIYEKRKDKVFESPQSAEQPFVFSKDVADAFDDMAARSIPAYHTSLDTMKWLLEDQLLGQFEQGHIYDLGASTGAFELLAQPFLEQKDWEVIAVDLSQPMIDQAKARLRDQPAQHKIQWRCEDVAQTQFQDSILVIANYCLQFVSPEQRISILARAFQSMKPGAFLLLSEKTTPQEHEENWFLSRYDHFKIQNGYSKEEIIHKRIALQNVLKPWSKQENEDAMKQVGFQKVSLIQQNWNFCTWIAQK